MAGVWGGLRVSSSSDSSVCSMIVNESQNLVAKRATEVR